MKKYIISYFILFIITIVLICTGGVPFGINMPTYFSEAELSAGFGGIRIFLIYNLIIAIIMLFVGVMITRNKNNELKNKRFLLIIYLILWLFIPIEHVTTFGRSCRNSRS